MTTTTTAVRSDIAGSKEGRGQVIAGRVVTGLVVAFLTFDAATHLANPQFVKDAMKDAGWPVGVAPWIGLCMAVSLVLYLNRRTNVLGALLITAYLGGAVAVNVRIEASFFGSVLFPVYTAIFIWGGLWLRDPEVRNVLPLRR